MILSVGVFIWFGWLVVYLPPVDRVLCCVQICVCAVRRGSVEPAVEPIDEKAFGEFAPVGDSPGVGFAGFKLQVEGLVGWVCLKI